MLWKKKKKDHTPEEYREKAQEQIQDLKDQWKTFFRTGPIVIAATIVMIAVSIAWFVSNTKVDATGVQIRAAGSEFDIAAEAKPNVESATGAYDDLLSVSKGATLSIGNKNFGYTGEGKTSISWAITDDSNMQNNKDLGIEPGSSGKLTFYIISHKDGPLSVNMNLTFTGYYVEGWNSTAATNTAEIAVKSSDLKKLDEPTQQLLEGHVLFFAGYDEKSNSYKAWISDDAESWNMTLENTCIKASNAGNDTESSKAALLTRNEDGSLTWKIDQAVKEAAYPVTIYWVWPEMLESYLGKEQNTRYPLLFPKDSSDTDKLCTLPPNLFTTMCATGNGDIKSNRYFRWEDKETFSTTVKVDKLLQMRNKYNPAVYGAIAAYYNLADQYLGRNVQYAKLTLDAQ
ncbi:MAG: hypothetical protein ACLSGO_00750 [Lachnospiraceae bacterium]